MTAEIGRLAAAGGRLAIDTEFVSERRYQALLCLAQVAVHDPAAPDGIRTEVVDPLGDEPRDPAPLAAALADPAVEVVMHAGRQDVAILRRTWDTEVTNVFDTQVAAAFLGHGLQKGYEPLVREVLGVKLGGGEGFTRWDRRPLTAQQIEYARADAAHLLDLGTALEERLEKEGRLGWAREECRALEAVTDDRDPLRMFERLPRLERLRPAQRAVAWELVQWRERHAREIDRAATSIIPDHVLAEVARKRPRTREDLDQIRGLPAQTLHRRGKELLAAVARGDDAEAPPVPAGGPRRDPGDAPVVALCQALLRHRSAETGLASELIATQSELGQLVGDAQRGEEPELRVLRGWRREVVGDELLALIAGRLALAAGADGRLRVVPAGS